MSRRLHGLLILGCLALLGLELPSALAGLRADLRGPYASHGVPAGSPADLASLPEGPEAPGVSGALGVMSVMGAWTDPLAGLALATGDPARD